MSISTREKCGEHAMGQLRYVPSPCCSKHKAINIDECPLCVKEERDKIKATLEQNDPVMFRAFQQDDEERAQLRQERDRLRVIVKGLEGETADKVMWREEAARLRELIPQAWQAGMECMQDGGPCLDQWMQEQGLS